MRLPVTGIPGVGALTVAGAAAVAADHSIASAVIVAVGGLLTLVIGQVTAEVIRRSRKPIDHHAEVVAEQAELVDHLLSELVEERAARLDAENEVKRLRRSRRGPRE